MSAISKIQWTDRTWNPVRGCSVISPGCVNCYAMKQAHRFSGPGRAYEGLTKQTSAGPQWTGHIREVVSALNEPLGWRKPSRVFVNSMSDLFHDGVSDEFIQNVFTVMAVARQHTFQILTKRPDRMQELLSSWRADDMYTYWHGYSGGPAEIETWPLPNVWLGVSAEDQQRAHERIPKLLGTPAAVRFVSAEPLLGPIWFHDFAHKPAIDWVIVGGESGAGARRCDVAWIRSIVEQCRKAGVSVFTKQLGGVVIDRNDAGFMGDEPDHWPDEISQRDAVEHDLDGSRDGYQGAPVRVHLVDRKGGDPAEWPEDLRVREFPESERVLND